MVNNRNLSFLFGILFIISLFLTWIKKLDYSLIEISRFAQRHLGLAKTIPQYMFFYIGFVFLILGIISLLMNFNNKIRMARIVLYLAPLYFIAVCVLNADIIEKPDSSFNIIDLLRTLGLGFYLFLISYVGLLKYLKIEKKSGSSKPNRVGKY